jgi:hypothetical protein
MEAGGLEGVGQHLDGRRGIAVAYSLIAQARQDRPDHFPIPNPLARTFSFQIVHNGILPHVGRSV